jgi:hypothetical protein
MAFNFLWQAILMPEETHVVPIYLALAAFVFILILDGNRWICQKGHLCTICNKPVHTLSQKTGGEKNGGMKFYKDLTLLSGRE